MLEWNIEQSSASHVRPRRIGKCGARASTHSRSERPPFFDDKRRLSRRVTKRKRPLWRLPRRAAVPSETGERRVLLLIELPAAASAGECDGSGDLVNVGAAGNFLRTEAHDMG